MQNLKKTVTSTLGTINPATFAASFASLSRVNTDLSCSGI
jgi:hypothetical protein